jgi:hypothetical protein
MTVQFILMVNKQGQTRLSSYYTWMSIPERVAMEVSPWPTEASQRCRVG